MIVTEDAAVAANRLAMLRAEAGPPSAASLVGASQPLAWLAASGPAAFVDRARWTQRLSGRHVRTLAPLEGAWDVAAPTPQGQCQLGMSCLRAKPCTAPPSITLRALLEPIRLEGLCGDGLSIPAGDLNDDG
jgi:hypothetical protein